MRHMRWSRLALVAGFVPVLALAQQQQGSGAPGNGNGQPRADGRVAAVAAGYVGSEACMQCHEKDAAQFAASGKGSLLLKHPRDRHEAQGCETCHGPGKAHSESGGEERGGMVVFSRKSPSSVADRNAVCLSCHEKTARLQWQGSAHEARDVACSDCHAVMHSDAEKGSLVKATVVETCGQCHQQQRNAALRTSHMPLGERKMECTSCHNPHGSPNPRLLLASSVNETCFQCHQEKRGPTLWEHPPVVENCANCHDPHGTSHEMMLKVSRPRLCQQCHAGATRHPTGPKDPTNRIVNGAVVADVQYLMNRQCNNCHTQIHGSNHPSGKFFTR